jgi:signal transduction histidine kinase
MSTRDNLEDILEARMLRERVRYALSFLNVNLALIPLGATLSCWAVWDYVAGWRAAAWITMLTVISFLRYIAFRRVQVGEMKFAELKRFEHVLGCSSVVTGLCFGLGTFSLYGTSPVSDLAILVTVNILIVGVATSYFAQSRYARINILVILGPTILYLGAQSQTLYRVLFLVTLLYLARTIGLISQFSGYFHELNRLGFALKEEKGEVERHYAAAERNYQDLQRSEALRHKLTQMLVHDLRTPLTAIVGHLHLIKRKSVRGETESALQSLERVRSLSEGLDTMVNDILEVSRSQAKQIPLLLRRTSWREISDGALEDLGRSRDNVRVIGEQAFEGCWDTQLLRRVLVNLLSNALRFSPPGEMVLMRVENDNQQLFVSIQDGGPGVPAESRERVFDQYHCLKRQGSDSNGFGIGLYFCKLAVEKHKGQIRVRRGGSVGAEFWFRIPLQQEVAV